MASLRTIDSAERVALTRLAVLTGVPLMALLVAVEWLVVSTPLWLLLLPDLTITAAVVGVLWFAVHSAGSVTNSLLVPGGTPPVREYSEQESLVVRGEIGDALDSFRSHLVAFPEDLRARLRLADLLAGPGNDPEAAVQCFLEVRALGPSEVEERVIGNALIDIYRGTGQQTQLKAELARFARLNHRNEAGAAAKRYLLQLVREDSAGADGA